MGKFMFVTLIAFLVILTGCTGMMGNKGSSNFLSNGDGTVTDTTTGLVWQQQHVKKAWDEADAYCQELDFANSQDWRLPSIEELKTIIFTTKSDLHIDLTAFPDTKPLMYWSGTDYETDYTVAYVIDFSNGTMLSDEKEFKNYFRCVH